MQRLSFIDDTIIEQAVMEIMKKASVAVKNADKNFDKNVIDPFGAVFEMSGFNLNPQEWVLNEKTRQAQKTLQNHIGNFHQYILGNISGMKNLGVGSVVDLESDKLKLIAEIKNKHNTISGGKLSDLYYDLEKLVMPKASKYKDFTAYYVTVIPKQGSRFDKLFTPSDKAKGAKCPANELIREIDGYSFYAKVSGVQNALELVFEKIIDTVNEKLKNSSINADFSKKFFDTAFGIS